MMIETVPATLERFSDVATLLAPVKEDAPACWCLAYRMPSGRFNAMSAPERPDQLQLLCRREPAPGVLAYLDGEPVGWCGVGPRTEFTRIERSRTIPKVDDVPAWSVVCFVVRPDRRGLGVADALLDGTVEWATSEGATTLEGYPIDAEGARVGSASAHVGTVSMFERAGFARVVETESRSAGRRRWLMRRSLVRS